ncbi:MAG: hypothetical protein H6722_14640 [Sandaracinus sp.]|nr:hypothetical protein [Sandaracinus sp.]
MAGYGPGRGAAVQIGASLGEHVVLTLGVSGDVERFRLDGQPSRTDRHLSVPIGLKLYVRPPRASAISPFFRVTGSVGTFSMSLGSTTLRAFSWGGSATVGATYFVNARVGIGGEVGGGFHRADGDGWQERRFGVVWRTHVLFRFGHDDEAPTERADDLSSPRGTH